MYLTRDDARPVEPRPRTPPAPNRPGVVHLEVVPADAAITVGGNLKHTGTPWEVPLDPGGYQIEIHRDGYMGWLTSIEVSAGQSQALRVTLEPMSSAVTAEATLILGSTPAGLDIVIDGTAVGKTPDKRAVPAGRHSIALRANGVDVWRREIEARASAVYELRPTITAPPAPSPSPPGSAASTAPSASPQGSSPPSPSSSPPTAPAVPSKGASPAPPASSPPAATAVPSQGSSPPAAPSPPSQGASQPPPASSPPTAPAVPSQGSSPPAPSQGAPTSPPPTAPSPPS
jgi:hypothetical protein